MVQKVSFRYNETTPWIYKNLEFGMDLDTRLALVGPNGAGKSTLLKLIAGEVSNVYCWALLQYFFQNIQDPQIPYFNNLSIASPN